MLVKVGNRVISLEYIVAAKYMQGTPNSSTVVPTPASALELHFVGGHREVFYNDEADELWAAFCAADSTGGAR